MSNLTIPNDIFLTGGEKYPSGAHQHMLEILGHFDRRDYRFYMLNWARRHNKSTLAINILIKQAWINPGKVYVYIAPTYGQAKRIQWDDPDMLFSYLPKNIISGVPKQQELLINLTNGSMIRLMGGEDPGKIKGINAQGVIFDEWSEFTHPKIIWQEVFLPILRRDNTRWAMFTFTPKGQTECFEMWLKAQNNPEWFTSELRASQANIIPIEEYRKAKAETDPLLFAQEYECAFITDEEMTFITSAMIEKAKLVNQKYSNVKKLVSIDPSLGGDECVIYYMENYVVKKQVIGHWQDSKIIAAEALVLAHEFRCRNFCVDYIGLGEGTYSHLNNVRGNNVIAVDVRGRATSPECFNLKSSMWWTVRRLFLDQKIPYPEDLELRRQISSVKFLFKNGLIACEDKKITKKNVGCSPDRAESFIQAIFTMLGLEPEPDTVVDDYDYDDDEDYGEYEEVAVM